MRPYSFRWLTALPLLALLAVPAGAEVQLRSGEFRVNRTTDFRQQNPVAAFVPSGTALVVWENDQTGIRGQFEHLNGTLVGGQLTLVANDGLNGAREGTVRSRRDPALAFLPSGHFLLAWTEEVADLRSEPFFAQRKVRDHDVYVQRFDAAGAPSGQRHRLNTTLAGSQSGPRLALLSNGQAVAVWKSAAGIGTEGTGSLFARLINAAGRPLGAEIEVSADAASDHPAVAGGRNGFIVAWDAAAGSQTDVFARLFEQSGAPRGNAFLLTGATAGRQRWPAVAAGADGNYLVAWQSYVTDRSVVRIHGQFVGAAGGFLGAPFMIGTDAGTQLAPAIAASRTGFVATWLQWEGLAYGIRAVELDALGARVGEEALLSRSRVTKNYRRSLATDGKGGFLAPWETVAKGRQVINARGLGM